jgi:maleate isomerase
LGFQNDERLSRLVEDRLGIPFTTSTLGLNKVLKFAKVQKLGLVTPYTEDVNDAIINNYTTFGYPITKEREQHLGIVDNIKIAAIDEATLHEMIKAVVEEGADAVTTFCTNWNAAHLVDKWEKEFAVPIFDSVATVVWDMCNIAGIDMGTASHWGRMFF